MAIAIQRQEVARAEEGLGQGAEIQVAASFEVVDDLLWQASAGRLPTLQSVSLGRSGRIGPLVELAMAIVAMPDAYRTVAVQPPVFRQEL